MNIMEELQEIFRDVFDDDELVITEQMTADDIDGWDSLTHIQLIAEVEQKYNIRFTTTEIMGAANVGEFAQAVRKRLEA